MKACAKKARGLESGPHACTERIHAWGMHPQKHKQVMGNMKQLQSLKRSCIPTTLSKWPDVMAFGVACKILWIQHEAHTFVAAGEGRHECADTGLVCMQKKIGATCSIVDDCQERHY